MLIMKILTCMGFFVAIQANITENFKCDNGIISENLCYMEDIILTDADRPYHLTIDQVTNILYFSYATDPEDESLCKTGTLNLNTFEYYEIQEVPNGFAHAVDMKTNKAYIGGSDGIYKFDYTTKEVELVGEKGNDISQMFFRDNVLYFSIDSLPFVYTFTNGTRTIFKDLEDTEVEGLVIDAEDFIIFFNSTGLYHQKLGTKNAIYYPESDNNTIAVTLDVNGMPAMSRNDGFYSVNKKSLNLNQFAYTLNNTYGFAYDKQNTVIFSTADDVRRVTIESMKRINEN